MRIDAHQHFWDPDRFHYDWMPSEPSPLRRSFLPEDLRPILERNNFDGSVVVQASTEAGEAEWLLDLARESPFVLGVVAWVDLTDEQLGDRLDLLQRDSKFKGVRHPVHDEPDDGWLLRREVIRGLKELERRGIPYDLLLRPRHVPIILELADLLPSLPMVIDHVAKPVIAQQVMDPWARNMEAVSGIPHLHVKLSGMITETDGKDWTAEHLRPYVQHVWNLFGPDRCMFGSDWPVCLLAGSWKEVLAGFTQALGPQPQEMRNRAMGEVAARFYGLRKS